MEQTSEINGIDVAKMSAFKRMCGEDPTNADHSATLVANWVGGARSRIEFKDKVLNVGGPGNFDAMQLLLAAMAACDVDLVAVHAAFLGLTIESLSVEVTGHFNLQAYLDLPAATGSGYDSVAYTVRASIPGATPAQIAFLRERCERSSPVGDSLARAIPVKLEFTATT
jgi:Predicted redox protein, regulator of disulfide bond formation